MDSKITNPHHILQMDSKITNLHTKSTKKAQFPQYIHQACFFLALWTLMVSRWSRRKYGVFSSAKSRGTYGMSKEGISSNWLYSSSSTTFSTPTILFFPRHNHIPVFLCKVGYIEHLLHILGEDKRFIFVTKNS